MLTLYTSPECSRCHLAKQWLDTHEIRYEVVDVTKNNNALNFIKEQGHRTVPQIYLGNEVLVEGGYEGLSNQDPTLLKEIIELKELRGLA